ncbi:DNA-binding protein RFX2 [Trichonephila clavata]|uniref:DNA-binding protein RFX2 n=1 Tax=Trichonephila clavata TaxID=2740835 RepID=A0A8X6LWV3_TRICU|nr:DNA-binding protein RFX2 [Trichonephila clavata]
MLKCLVAVEELTLKPKLLEESFAVVAMATQSFMSDMQALSIQQNSPVPPQQQSPQTSISQSNHTQSNQAPHSQNQTLDVRTQTVVSTSLPGQVTQGNQAPQKPQQTIQGVSVSSALATQVVVATHSPPISQPQQAAEAVVQASQPSGASQFIAVTVSEHDNQGEAGVTLQNQAVHPTYVQYVDNGEPNIYAGNNGQMAGYSVYSVTDASAMYTPATAGYYSNGNGTPVTYSQLIDENNYKVQGQVIEADAHHNLAPVSAAVTLTNRISPVSEDQRKVAEIISPFTNDQCVIQTLHSPHDNNQLQLTNQQNQNQSQPTHHSQHQNVRDMDIIHVQWLIDNYETAEGVSLPRSTLYNHYLRHCSEHKLDPVNAASFGKLIRSVFLGLRTRRLGTRGNSKYHYYGIRVKPNSPLNQISEENSGLRSQTLNQIKNRFKANLPAKSESNDGSSTSSTGGVASQTETTPSQPTPVPTHQHQQYLGDASTALPNFIEIDTCHFPLPEGITSEHLDAFKDFYREHCEAFLEAVVNLQFSMIETLWQTFWRTYNNDISRRDQHKLLNKTKFFQLCKHEPVLHFMRKSDYQFYQNLVDVLIPDVLRPIPSSLTQAIRNFAKCLETWLSTAMTGCPEEVIKVKVSAVSAFAQTLRRYTSLNHLAQAARAVLQNSSQINQMMADLNRVDFHNVQEQASWVCQCDENTVQRLEQDFKLTLQQQNSLEQWAQWLEGVVDLVLQPYEGKPDFPKAARQFLLKWSFYSSMVIRDLTLRSAASFGSFHLIRLLYDEYMFYLIEHRVAKAINETPIAVMGEFIGLGAKMNSHNNEFVLNSVKGMPVCDNSKNIIENGSLNESNCSISQDIYSSNAAMTNGLKEAAAMQASLIGQPQVRFMNSVSETGNGENINHMNKKLKTV